MADLTRRASLSGASFSNMPPLPPAPPSFDQFEFAPLRDGQQQNNSQHQNGAQQQQRPQLGPGPSPYDPAPPPPQQQQPPPPPSSASGQPKGGSASRADPNSAQQGRGAPQGQNRPPPVAQYVHPAYANDPAYAHLAHQQQLQQQAPPASSHAPPPSIGRRESAVPGWAVPPRVLLVEDDTVCRKLSSKFLEKFGCQIDVAVDGVSAVNKMNAQKYDLVLMVSVGCIAVSWERRVL